jgi:hypothetical protein
VTYLIDIQRTNRIARANPSFPTTTSALMRSVARSISMGNPKDINADRGSSTRITWPPSIWASASRLVKGMKSVAISVTEPASVSSGEAF